MQEPQRVDREHDPKQGVKNQNALDDAQRDQVRAEPHQRTGRDAGDNEQDEGGSPEQEGGADAETS